MARGSCGGKYPLLDAYIWKLNSTPRRRQLERRPLLTARLVDLLSVLVTCTFLQLLEHFGDGVANGSRTPDAIVTTTATSRYRISQDFTRLPVLFHFQAPRAFRSQSRQRYSSHLNPSLFPKHGTTYQIVLAARDVGWEPQVRGDDCKNNTRAFTLLWIIWPHRTTSLASASFQPRPINPAIQFPLHAAHHSRLGANFAVRFTLFIVLWCSYFVFGVFFQVFSLLVFTHLRAATRSLIRSSGAPSLISYASYLTDFACRPF